MFKKIKTLLLSSLVLGGLVGAVQPNQAVVAQEEEALEVQFVPTNNDGSMEARAQPLADLLSEQLGREVNVTLATDYTTIVQAMASGQVDLGIMPPAAYVQARDLGSAEAILTSVLGAFDDETGLPVEGETTGSFQGEILVRADSDMEELTDLVGKKIATLSPNSASGYIYPVAEMIEAGIDVTSDVTLTTVNDIPSEITAVLNGQQDAAFVFEGARNVFQGAFPDNDLMAELKVLYLTEGEIPNDAIAVQPDMDEELRQAIKDAFLSLAETEEGLEIMSLWSHQGYDEVDESVYDQIKEYTEIAAQ
ncbi:phosphate/phosphite/phosphonate ABC transporter substrate-binding protein [Aerococcaceae bacterium INB8]|uniref:Phosphate/phosphite/phosphonate ABC transporter substrate-binding protein n=1 Tax=Ruoffia halotolerans TaxID=2748684 RepID=A0A839A5I1_9LACT|nr:phosphate/phosphite/phosphonate ABC transporter substrate-binding protein [Ruoffia halotolerans]MBA5728963.1 phosphate/phosphite/phosphonate ABC transporter substrate-binding protein [Ruoffia halotolerans]